MSASAIIISTVIVFGFAMGKAYYFPSDENVDAGPELPVDNKNAGWSIIPAVIIAVVVLVLGWWFWVRGAMQ